MKKIILFGILAASVALGQFDAVAIKPSPADARGGGFNLSPGRLTAKNCSLKELVKFAYDLHDYQLSGGVSWMDTEHYEVLATFPAGTKDAERARMMQAMLADRFALAVHRESKEISGYALVPGKNGSKLHSVDSEEHAGMMLGGNPATGQRTLTGTKAPIRELVSILASLLGRPVEDLTGISGTFDFHIEWTPDPVSEVPLRKGNDGPALPPAADPGPTLFTVLQESLGLKLETRKTPVEAIVIDHAEKPSAN